MRHNKPRFRLSRRVQALKRLRKVVEFMAGFPAEPFYYFKKRMPINRRTENDEKPSTEDGHEAPDRG